MKIAHIRDEEIVWIGKDEVTIQTAVNEYAVDTRCSKIAGSIELASQSCSKNTVHKHMRQRIGRGMNNITKTLVNRPYFYTLRNFLIRAKAIGIDLTRVGIIQHYITINLIKLIIIYLRRQ